MQLCKAARIGYATTLSSHRQQLTEVFLFPFVFLLNSPSKIQVTGFPGGAVVESLPANAGDTGSSPGLGRSHMPRSN